MASRRFGVDDMLDAIFDDDFSLSDGSASEEEGKDVYAYLGEPTLLLEDVETIGSSIVDDRLPSSDDDGELTSRPGARRKRRELGTPLRSIRRDIKRRKYKQVRPKCVWKFRRKVAGY